MAACSAGDQASVEFNGWLSQKLLALNEDVDLDVFVSYIAGILESETSDEDKEESLADFLSEILTDDSVDKHCKEIVEKWTDILKNGTNHVDLISSNKLEQSIDATIHKIIEQQNQQASRTRVLDEEHLKRKAAILANYAEVSDGDESDFDPSDGMPSSTSASASAGAATGSTSEELLVKNMNVLLVKEREAQEREKSRLEAEQKKLKDKDDREKQKNKQQERKDAEKKRTQKGEKRR